MHHSVTSSFQHVLRANSQAYLAWALIPALRRQSQGGMYLHLVWDHLGLITCLKLCQVTRGSGRRARSTAALIERRLQ